MYTPERMKFGIFMAPFHRVGENPTLALKRDLDLIQLLDRLGFEEAWIGEHHSFGRELIADPAVFIGYAAAVTRRIKLGTGVTSLPYHHPLMVADRMVQLDHMTEGRVMLGVGPGVLTSDAHMMGIDPVVQRQRMAESLGAIMALLEARGSVDIETDWFTLRDARLQLASFTRPHLPVAVAASVTPSGPTLAGKHGIGLLSVAGANDESFTRTWQWVEEAAEQSGKATNRGEWRVVVPVHLAHSKQEAIDDLREGYAQRAYIGDRKVPLPPETSGGVLLGSAGIASGTIDEAVENGAIIAGSVDDAVEAFERIQRRAGGLGGILCLAHEMATTEKTNRSYELLARYVAPHFQNQLGPVIESRDWVEDHQRLVFGQVGEAFAKAFDDAGKEIPAEVAPSIAMMRRRPRPEPPPDSASR